MTQGTKGTKEIATRYPVEEGLEAGTETQVGRHSNLVPEQGTNVPRRYREGL